MHSSTASCTNHAACLPDNHGGSSTASALACVAVCCTTLCPPSASARRGCDVDQSTAAFSRRLIGGPLSRRAVVEDSWSTDAVSLVLWWGQPRELTRAALKGSLNEIAEGPLAARPCWSAHRRLAWRQTARRRCPPVSIWLASLCLVPAFSPGAARAVYPTPSAGRVASCEAAAEERTRCHIGGLRGLCLPSSPTPCCC